MKRTTEERRWLIAAGLFTLAGLASVLAGYVSIGTIFVVIAMILIVGSVNCRSS